MSVPNLSTMRTKITAIAEARMLAIGAGVEMGKVQSMVNRLMSQNCTQADADIICVDLDPSYGTPDLSTAGLL
jgi:hypothetical protein